jgi:hypothetical protein
MQRQLVAVAAAIGMAAIPARSVAGVSTQPVKLTDAQLDEVVAGDGHDHGIPEFVIRNGHGPRWQRNDGAPASIGTQVNFIIRDVAITFNIGPNSPVNLALLLQLSLLSQTGQTGSVTALQAGHG